MNSNSIIQDGIDCLQQEATALQTLIQNLDDSFARAVTRIYQCTGKVIVTGVGKSGNIAAKIAATLSSTGTPSFFLNALDAFHGDLGAIASNDVVIALSYSGNTDELLRFIPLLLERHIPIIGISGNPDSLLAQYSDIHINIHVTREADPLNLAPTSSTTVMLALGDAIACALMRQRHFKDTDFALYHPGGTLGRRLLTQVKDVMRKDNLPILSLGTTIPEALVAISIGKLGTAIILDGQKIIGLVTDGDIRRALQQYGAESFNLHVDDIMTRQPIIVRDSMHITEAEQIFKQHRVHTLVVINDLDQFVGFLAIQDCQI